MNILVAINEKYTKQLNALLKSIQYSNPNELFRIYVLNNNLKKEYKKEVEKGINKAIINLRYLKITKKELEEFALFEKKGLKEVAFRIFATKYLPKTLDRILYLDSDIIVINELKNLYEMDFEGNYYIATTHVRKILHKFHEIRLNINEEIPYINKGVLLINLKELRKRNIKNDIEKYLQDKKLKVFLSAEQDIITAVYGDKIKLVDSLKYNLGDRELNFYNINHYKNPIGLKWIRKNTVIIHYHGKNKPWEKGYFGKLGCFYYNLERSTRNKGKVLILSCGTGGGHNSAAIAVQEALSNQGMIADFIEYLDIINSNIKDTVNNLYLKSTHKQGSTFKVVYKLGELYQKTNLKSPVYGLNSLNKDKLYKYIKENEYEYIVTTHLFAAQVLTSIKKENHINFMAIATDYVCIPFWKETNPDYFIIPNEILREDFVKKGVKNSKILPLGIPTRKTFSEKYDQNDCRKLLNLDLNKKYILILTGSMGFGNVKEMLNKLLDEIRDANFIVACGTNESLKEALIGKERVIALSYTNDIDLYMKSSDIILSKPGGLTSTEIAVLEKPFIHTMPIPGCETYNANFFASNNMSLKSETLEEIVENTKKLLKNFEIQKKLIKKQKKYVNKFSATQIAEIIKKQIETRKEKWEKKLEL